ncbi:unnamed protein product [Cutaneotrichosporon oleaginosum]
MPAIKREPTTSTPYTRPSPERSPPPRAPKPAANGEGRQRLVEMVIERGIASVMGSNIAATQAETGLTAKQIQNHLGKGRSLRAQLEEFAKRV